MLMNNNGLTADVKIHRIVVVCSVNPTVGAYL